MLKPPCHYWGGCHWSQSVFWWEHGMCTVSDWMEITNVDGQDIDLNITDVSAVPSYITNVDCRSSSGAAGQSWCEAGGRNRFSVPAKSPDSDSALVSSYQLRLRHKQRAARTTGTKACISKQPNSIWIYPSRICFPMCVLPPNTLTWLLPRPCQSLQIFSLPQQTLFILLQHNMF